MRADMLTAEKIARLCLVLQGIVTGTVAMVRPTDAVGRLGGEEFATLLSETGARSALATIGRIRRGIANTPFDIGALGPSAITASFGVAPLGEEDTADSRLARAKSRLYLKTRGGRKRVELVDKPRREAAA